jgi:hypothetical protein
VTCSSWDIPQTLSYASYFPCIIIYQRAPYITSSQSKTKTVIASITGFLDAETQSSRSKAVGSRTTPIYATYTRIPTFPPLLTRRARQAFLTITCTAAFIHSDLLILGHLMIFRRIKKKVLPNVFSSYFSFTITYQPLTVPLNQKQKQWSFNVDLDF